jgi:hypothetical protein
LAHRALKAFYPLTNKRDTPAQLARHEYRRRVLQRVAKGGCGSYTSQEAPVDLPTGLQDHHYIRKLSCNNPLDIFRFLRDHEGDPAVAVSGNVLT